MARPRSGPSGRHLTPSCSASGATDEHEGYALSWRSVHKCASSLCRVPVKISTASGPPPCPGRELEQAAPQWRFSLFLTHSISHSCAEKEIDSVCVYGCVFIHVPVCVYVCVSVCVYVCVFSPVQFSRVRLFATLWTAARQASLSIINSWSSPKPMSIESVMPSNHLILCRSLLLLPSIFPSIRVFSNEPVLRIRWPKFWLRGVQDLSSSTRDQTWVPCIGSIV